MSLPAADDSGAVFGRYKLLERIGAGGMATIYRALSESQDGPRQLVIKRVLPELSRDREFSSMLVAEARLSARLNHPNIVQVYELGKVGDEFYLAMELVDGIDLVRLLNGCVQSKQLLPVGLACHLVVKLADALAYAHELRDTEGRPLAIVHRDVSPSNVMISRAGAIKLLDFGVAKAAEHVRDERTRTGTLKGKVNYLSPESAEGFPVDKRTDVFALGIVLHECLTLRRLFKAEGDLQTLRLIREAKVAPPSAMRREVDSELDRVVLKMLARDPAARYPDCRALLDELAPIADRLGGGAAELCKLVGSIQPEPAAPKPAEDMDSGPTPPIHVLNLLAEPSRPTVPKRPRWLVPALAGAVAVPAIAIALLVGRHTRLPPMAVAAPPPPAIAPHAGPAPAPKPGLIVVDTDVARARVALDGRVVADRVSGARVPAAAGEHELTISAPRRKPFVQKVTVAAGGTVELAVKLEKSYGGSSPSSPSSSPAERKPAERKPARGENYLVNPFAK